MSCAQGFECPVIVLLDGEGLGDYGEGDPLSFSLCIAASTGKELEVNDVSHD